MHTTPETQQFIHSHEHEDVRTLALQAKKYPHIDMPFALTQIAGRQIAKYKIPTWYATEQLIYPVHLSLEQCSSEVTAKYKSSLFKGESLADLTGGFGIDCAFLASGFNQVTYIERQKELCDIATHNFLTLGLTHITVHHADSIKALAGLTAVECIFIDPARRSEHGGKTVLVSDCEPNVEELESVLLQKAPRVMVKLSPMLDLSLALRSLPHTSEVHIVSVQNECKELLLILSSSKAEVSPMIHAVNFTSKRTETLAFTQEEENETNITYTHKVGKFLYEPNASVLKAGALRTIAHKYGVSKLHPNSHLYTSDVYVEDFPGRCFNVHTTFSIKERKQWENIHKANISTRNFPLSVAELRKRTKLKDGGDTYLFGTTLNDEKKVLIRCTKCN